MREQRRLHVLAHRQRARTSRRSGTSADAQPPIARGAGRPARCPPARPSRRRGELAVDHVEAGRLAGAVGPIRASISPRRRSKPTSSTAAHAAERLRQPAHRQQRRSCAAHRVSRMLEQTSASGCPRCRAGKPGRGEHDEAEQRAPVVGLARDDSCSPTKRAAPTHRPGQRLDAPQQHHHQAVDRLADGERLGRDRCP